MPNIFSGGVTHSLILCVVFERSCLDSFDGTCRYLLLADNDAPAGSFNLDRSVPNGDNGGGGVGNSVAGVVAANQVLSPKSHRQLRQYERDDPEPRPRERSPSASLSMSMLQSANPMDAHRQGGDVDGNETEGGGGGGGTGTDKWAARIKFLMKLYRMDVLNDKVLQKLSDRDLERSIKVREAQRDWWLLRTHAVHTLVLACCCC